jgi:hypothetical protein
LGERERAEERATPVNDFEENIEAAIDAMPKVGLWLDTSGLTPEETVDALLRRRDEALIRV